MANPLEALSRSAATVVCAKHRDYVFAVKITHQFLKGFLPRSESRAIYIFTMACYDIAISLLGGRLATSLGLWVPVSSGALSNAQRITALPWWHHAVVDLLISPVIESLVLIGIIELIRHLNFSVTSGIVVSTLFFSLLHSATIPVWGIICIPAFFIESASYVYWRRISLWAGFQTVVLLHFCSNVAPFLYSLGRTH